MNELVKNLGVILILIGVLVLAVPYFTKSETNTLLLCGMGLTIIGYLAHILINKRAE